MMRSAERAERGARIFDLYAGEARDPALCLQELLCDLLFWSGREGVSFPEMLRRAIQARDSESLEELMQGASDET